MNLDQLEVVSAIVEHGSFRAAALALHRSQPALSAAIKNLEDEFGLRIFDRSSYRPKLTESGAAFVAVARQTLESVRYAARVAFELGQNKAETKLRVSVDPLISTDIIKRLASICLSPLLPVDLIMDQSILKGSYQPLLSGKIDLALAPCPRDEKRIEKIVLENVTLVGAVSRQLFPGKKRVSEGFLQKNPQILVYDKSFDEPVDDLIPEATVSRIGPKIFVPDHLTKLRLIEAGIGWGRISKTEFENANGLLQIDRSLSAPVHLELCLLRARHRPIGPTARQIWNLFGPG